MMRLIAVLLGKRRWENEIPLPLVRGKFDRILELARDREVLDIGCVGGEMGINLDQTSHARISSVAKTCTGVDIVEQEIDRWRTAGYDAVVANAEDFRLGKRFDVIVASDVLEHVANPGRFLEAAREHLLPGGALCIVTPNALSLNNAMKTLAGLRVGINPEHVCWYDRTTLRQLLARYGFHPVEEYWQDYQRHPLTTLILRLRRSLAAHLIVIARQTSRGTTA
jgi:2-polyprenyl-3-methyl-5-hydroxy-6-metoxy-1,4-benzoquinol methylase